MTSLDLIVIGAYFALVMAIGFYFSGRTRTATGYFLAGRQVGWVAIGASLFATNISSEHLIGLAGSGASTGLAVGHFEWLAVFMVLALGWIFVPFYLRSGVATMPEFLERRYGPAARMYLTTVSVIAYVFTKISVSLYAGSLVLREVAGWDFYTSAIVMVLATGAYTVVGGLAAVIYTELLQAVVLIGGAVILTGIGLAEAGGFAGLRANLPAGFFHMFKPATDPDFPWTGIIFGAPILGIWYWCTDQVIVQRVLSARNEAHARGGAIFSGFLKILPVFILVLPGMIARVLYPDIQGDQAYPALVVRLLPAGLTGLMIAALMAALMSSLAATFNSASTLITLDVYKRVRPDASDPTLVTVGRLATLLMVVLGILWVPFIPFMSSQLYIYMQSVQAYISPPIAAVFLLGVLWPRANRQGAIASLLTGAVIGGTRFLLEVGRQSPLVAESAWLTGIVEIHFLHFAVLIFIVSIAVLVGVSLATSREPAAKLSGLTFATLDHPYTGLAGARSTVAIQIAASVVVSLTVVGLWWHFA
jgi:solute:Na+ symporter, SSS family